MKIYHSGPLRKGDGRAILEKKTGRMKMFPIKEFEKRFQEILSDLDAVKEQARGEAADAMDELNANFEDALFVIESIGEDEDWREAFEDALEEFEDLHKSYCEQVQAVPGLQDVAGRLNMAIGMARANL